MSTRRSFTASALLAAGLLSCLAACAGREGAGRISDATVPQDFRALGTEPFWSIEVAGSRIAYATPDSPARLATEVVRSGSGDRVRFAGRIDGTHFGLTVSVGPCSDGMSDRTYPLIVEAAIGDTRLQGCALPDK